MRAVSVLCAVVLLAGIAYPMYSDIFAVSYGDEVERGWTFVVGVASYGGARLLIVAASSSTDQIPGLEFCLRHEIGYR